MSYQSSLDCDCRLGDQSMLAFDKVMLYIGVMNKAFSQACKIVGSAELARRLGVTPQAVNEWKQGNRPVPVDRCAEIERVTDGKITRRDLRPDDWERIWPELSDMKSGRRITDKNQ
jgi:DNA-binding transcriptional regulator YdaS (Cro superfamily)